MIAIIGPTGSGKTDLAVQISAKLSINIVNADSRQIYKYMDIGTAKPTSTQRKKLKHYLIDQILPCERYSLNQFINEAKIAIKEIQDNNIIPIIVGGTGLYVWALLDDWKLPDVQPDMHFRKELEEKFEIHGKSYISDLFISELGKSQSENFDTNNIRRLIRYLEIIKSIGPEKFLSSTKTNNNDNLIFGLDYSKNEQELKITNRIDMMIKNGWIKEVENLIQKGYNLSNHSMTSIGYKEIYLYLNKKIDFVEMRKLIIKRTLNFVKKQRTWFKKTDNRINWVDGINNSDQIDLIKNKIIKYNNC